MKKFLQSIAAVAGSFLAPVAAFAQTFDNNVNVSGGTDAQDVLQSVRDVLDVIIPILITLGVVYLIWGVIGYISAKDEEKKKEARGVMINGAIGLFFILAIWGIIGLISSTLGISVGGDLDTGLIPGVGY